MGLKSIHVSKMGPTRYDITYWTSVRVVFSLLSPPIFYLKQYKLFNQSCPAAFTRGNFLPNVQDNSGWTVWRLHIWNHGYIFLGPISVETRSVSVRNPRESGPSWCNQGLYSLSGKTSYHQISRSLEAARLDVTIIVSLWNLTGISAALLRRCLSNFRAIGKV